MYEIYLQSFVLYFVVIDPFGTTPIFMSLTKNQNAKEKIKSASEGVLTATIILIFFSIVGNFLLSYLNISLGAFKIAGGIILFIISLEMLFDKRQERKEKDIENVSNNIAIFPLAIPLLSGPAAITSVIVIVSQFGDNFAYPLIGTASLISVMLITFILFFIVSKLTESLRTILMFWSYFSNKLPKFLPCIKFLGYPSNINLFL